MQEVLSGSIWSSNLPVKIIFGNCSLEQLGVVVAETADKVLLVSGFSAERSGLLERCRELIEVNDIVCSSHVGVRENPDVSEVNEIVELVRSTGGTAIVAVGGGSVIDACKAAAAVCEQGGCVEEYLDKSRLLGAGKIPMIAVPTTAGTGAELSRGAILNWSDRNIKTGLRGECIFPHTALVDPELLATVPRRVAAICGFDVYSHAIETYISKKSTPLTRMHSLQAVRGVCHALPVYINSPEDASSRAEMAYHSMMMGYNLANSSTCLPHRMQYPLGVLTDTPHALGLAALTPAWVESAFDTVPERFLDVFSSMAHGLTAPSPRDKKGCLKMLEGFLESLDLSVSLSDLGVTLENCRTMADQVSGALANDPSWQEGTDLGALYEAAL